MFIETIKSKCLDKIHYVCIFSLVGDVFLMSVPRKKMFLTSENVKRYSLEFYRNLWKIHVKKFKILVWKWSKKNHIKNVFILKNDVSREIINFQKDVYFKKHFWRRRFSILFPILSTIVSVKAFDNF